MQNKARVTAFSRSPENDASPSLPRDRQHKRDNSFPSSSASLRLLSSSDSSKPSTPKSPSVSPEQRLSSVPSPSGQQSPEDFSHSLDLVLEKKKGVLSPTKVYDKIRPTDRRCVQILVLVQLIFRPSTVESPANRLVDEREKIIARQNQTY